MCVSLSYVALALSLSLSLCLYASNRNYLAHATSLYVCSSQICQDFFTLLDDPSHPNEFTTQSNSMRIEHENMSHEYVPKLQHSFSTTILSQIDEECIKNSEIQKRINRRQEVFSELGYYQTKINELRDERTLRASKGKSESSSDVEKYERNQKKLDETCMMFNDLNSRLLTDMRQLFDSERIAKMGPLLQRFLAHEKKIAETYGAGLAKININNNSSSGNSSEKNGQ
jgi:hypothetical protein